MSEETFLKNRAFVQICRLVHFAQCSRNNLGASFPPYSSCKTTVPHKYLFPSYPVCIGERLRVSDINGLSYTSILKEGKLFGNVNMAAVILKRCVVSSKYKALRPKNLSYFPVYLRNIVLDYE